MNSKKYDEYEIKETNRIQVENIQYQPKMPE